MEHKFVATNKTVVLGVCIVLPLDWVEGKEARFAGPLLLTKSTTPSVKQVSNPSNARLAALTQH